MKLTLLFSLFTCLQLYLIVSVQSDDSFAPQLDISTGKIKGKSIVFRGSSVYQFLGIPYAEPPLNDLRWQKPVPKKPWDGTLDANNWGPYCIQNIFPGFNTGAKIDENCLMLNVFVTKSSVDDKGKGSNNNLRPVLVWFHGGGFNMGSANEARLYDGSVLAALHDVIVVSVNYRLGPLGFLYAPKAGIPGNMGLWDQRLALKWVKDNIESFGGNPNQVTIFGESAGSMSVSAHIVSPQSKGLFKNAIMQSGAIYDLDRWTIANLVPSFMTSIGCKPSDDISTCLSTYQPLKSNLPGDISFWPIAGDEFLPEHPEKIIANNGVDPSINVLLGTVGNEGALMLMIKDIITFNPINPVNLTISHAKDIFGKLFGKSLINHYADRYLTNLEAHDYDQIRLAVCKALGDTILTCPTYAFAQDLVKSGFNNVYAYHQSQRPAQSIIEFASASKWLPASHADDISMVFGYPLINTDKYTIEDTILSFLMMDTWVTFARHGKLTSLGQQKWSPWTNHSRPTLVFDSKKIGTTMTEPVDFCLKSYPFPLDIPYPLSMEPGALAKIADDSNQHNEL